MSRAVRLTLAGAAVVAAAVVLAIVAAPEDEPVRTAPHGNALSAAELDRVLRAADAASSGVPQAELEAQGRELFNSTELARSGEACGSCHSMGGANPDVGIIKHPIPEEPEDFSGPRDVPHLFDVARTAPYGWDASVPTLEQFMANAVTLHFTGGSSQATGERVAALVAYVKTIRPPRSAFDRGTFSAAARRGEEIFVGKGGCIGCHGGPQFTDNSLHILGVPKVQGSDTDCGAGNPDCPAGGPLTGAFNTPSLRNVSRTAPYFHNGRFGSLRQVVDFYNTQAVITPAGLGLTNEELNDLVEYLKTL